MRVDHDILVRYFLGQCNEEEKEAIHEWLESDEVHKKEFVRERIRFDASLLVDEQELASVRKAPFSGRTWTFTKVAAAIILLLGSSFLFQFYLSHPEDAALQTVYVPAGSRTCVELPDGTSAWLNSNSTIYYPNIFSKGRRIVELDGEAYFDVTPDRKNRFIVRTDKYNIEVMGTTFNVEAYKDEDFFKTTLYTGSVRLYKDQCEEEALYLRPGQAAELIGDQLQVTTASMSSYRWKDGLIILEGHSFREVMHLFEKYFDMQIIIENENVKDLAYNGKLRIVDGIDHVLRVLQNDFRFTYHRDVETNIIYIY